MEMPVYDKLGLNLNLRELTGFILKAEAVDQIVRRLLYSEAGIETENIRIVKVGRDQSGNAHIVVEIAKRAFKKSKNPNPSSKNGKWRYFDSFAGGDKGNSKVPKEFFDNLRNKVFYGDNDKLHYDKVHRKDETFYRFEFDTELLIAYVFNINFDDPFYGISAMEERWTDKELDDLSGKERKILISKIKEYKSEGLVNTRLFIAFSKDYVSHIGDKEYRGFDIAEVEAFRRKKKKHKKKKHD